MCSDMMLLTMTMVTFRWKMLLKKWLLGSFSPEIFLNHQLCGRHCSRHQGNRQSPCSYILLGARNDKQVNKTGTSNIRLWQALGRKNKQEGVMRWDEVYVMREGLVEKVNDTWMTGNSHPWSGRKRFLEGVSRRVPWTCGIISINYWKTQGHQ